MATRLLEDDGGVFNAEFEIAPMDDGVDALMHSRSGNKGAARKPTYNSVLHLFLERMRRSGVIVGKVVVDSQRARTRHSLRKRTIEPGYPVRLDDGTSSRRSA